MTEPNLILGNPTPGSLTAQQAVERENVETAIQAIEKLFQSIEPPAKRYGESPVKPTLALPTAAAARKAIPVFSGFLAYFPDAVAAVAELSRIGNDQHNPGKPLHWDRSKSGDEKDALARHLLDAGQMDTDGILHSTKVAWRAMANLQKELEALK